MKNSQKFSENRDFSEKKCNLPGQRARPRRRARLLMAIDVHSSLNSLKLIFLI